MDLREKSIHKSTGLDRDYFDGWKDKPLYTSSKKGKALSLSGVGKSYANLRSFARDTLEQLKKNLGYLGSITDESISGDSEDISFTVRMRDERDFKRLQADIRNNQKDFNKIRGVSVPGYSLEYVEAKTPKQTGIYRADFYYCFDWDSLDESRISMAGNMRESHDVKKGNKLLITHFESPTDNEKYRVLVVTDPAGNGDHCIIVDLDSYEVLNTFETMDDFLNHCTVIGTLPDKSFSESYEKPQGIA